MKRKPIQAPGWPQFDAPLLQEVVAAFQRRRKALRNQAGLTCARDVTETDRSAFERLNFDLCPGYGDMRLSIWEDGKLWVRLCVPSFQRQGGWAFQDDFHGSAQDVSPATLVALVEATIRESFYPGRTDPDQYRTRLRTIWQRVRSDRA